MRLGSAGNGDADLAALRVIGAERLRHCNLQESAGPRARRTKDYG